MMKAYVVDAFSSGPFSGNATMVCILPRGSVVRDDLCQKIASEINLSETAFVSFAPVISNHCDLKTSSHFSLRWFSPTCEVSMCGHGTLATAAVIWTVFENINKELYFNTMSGTLKATKTALVDETLFTIDLPASTCERANKDDFAELIKLVVGSSDISDCQYCSASNRLLICLPDGTTRTQLESLPLPNFTKLLALRQSKVKGIIVTVKSNDKDYDFYSRYYAPWWGNNEDHVTGAAHTTLGPYWSKVLQKESMKARQCSSRGGDLTVKMNWNEKRVLLTGSANITIKGTLLVPLALE